MKVEGKPVPRRLGPRDLARFVGPAPFLAARLGTEPQVGVSLGLAYTGAGGDVLRIECVVSPGKGDFHLTGQLGEIMQESVTAAWGYLKTSLVRDPVLSGLWVDSPGRAYLLENYQPPESGDEAGALMPPAERRQAEAVREPADAPTVMGKVIEIGARDTVFRPEAEVTTAGASERDRPGQADAGE